jgi:hypothetical protein
MLRATGFRNRGIGDGSVTVDDGVDVRPHLHPYGAHEDARLIAATERYGAMGCGKVIKDFGRVLVTAALDLGRADACAPRVFPSPHGRWRLATLWVIYAEVNARQLAQAIAIGRPITFIRASVADVEARGAPVEVSHWARPRYRRGRKRCSPSQRLIDRRAERGRLDRDIGRAGRVARVEYGWAVAEKCRVVEDRLQRIFGHGEGHDGRRVIEAIEALEQEFGVMAPSQACMWDALRLVGIDDAIQGYGRAASGMLGAR